MKYLRYIVIASQLILSFAFILVALTLLGIYLDSALHIQPFGILIGGFLGIAGGFAVMIYLAKRIENL